tara:strand:- start:954 stop:1232 length:279 start_codon:yes stop_codon:yes gene_type:complete
LAKSGHDFGFVGLESRGELPKSLGDTREGVDESESPEVPTAREEVDESESPEVRTARGDFDESKAAEVRPALSPTLDSLIQEQALHKTIKIS